MLTLWIRLHTWMSLLILFYIRAVSQHRSRSSRGRVICSGLLRVDFRMEVPQIQKEEAGDFKYLCRICKRKFACGRALGGHMRAHGAAEEEFQKRIRFKQPNGAAESLKEDEEVLNSIYGLRRNPKRSWRFADRDYSFLVAEDGTSGSKRLGSTFLRNSRACEACGREFSSWKALFGHMRCHSDRGPRAHPERGAEEEQRSGSPGDFWESSGENRRRNGDAFPGNPKENWEISSEDNEEEEEAAERGSESGSETAFGDRPDENPGRFRRLAKGKRSKRPRCDQSRDLPVCSDEENEEEEMAHCLVMLASGAGSWGAKRVAEFPGAADSSATSDCMDVKLLPHAEEEHASEVQKSCSVGRSKPWESEKKSKYECKTCRKMFHTYQALGGHRASHKKVKGCFARITVFQEENGVVEEEIIDEKQISRADQQPCADPDPVKPPPMDGAAEYPCGEPVEEITETPGASRRGPKVHECSICHRTFASGQALGGHKRCHLVISEHTGGVNKQQKVPHRIEPAAREDLLDLNLPAPAEDDHGLHGVDGRHPKVLVSPIGPPAAEPGNRLGPCYIRPWWIGTKAKQGLFLYNARTERDLPAEDEADVKLGAERGLPGAQDLIQNGARPWLQV